MEEIKKVEFEVVCPKCKSKNVKIVDGEGDGPEFDVWIYLDIWKCKGCQHEFSVETKVKGNMIVLTLRSGEEE
jgi:transposase-like protein